MNTGTLILLCLLAGTVFAQKKPSGNGAPKIVDLKSLKGKPTPVDFIRISASDYKAILADAQKNSVIDTVSSFDYQQGVLISESPFDENSFIIHPPSTPFDVRAKVAAAVINERLTFFGICPDDNPQCPPFPPKGPDLPDLCDNPPCMPDFKIDPGFFPLPRLACTAVVFQSTLNTACALRKPCETRGYRCQPVFRLFQRPITLATGTQTRPLRFLYILCKCDCPQ